ncbi:MAG TPA: MG2 domain-containing protein, partial [Anaerolineae bacterium]
FKTGGADSMAWLTDLQTGQPVSGASVRFLSERDELGQDTTDRLGVAVAEHERIETWLPRYAISDDPFAVAINYWVDGVERWQYGISTEDFVQPYSAHFHTDRPIYRPGQTVYFKAAFRADDDARYSLPPTDEPVFIIIRDAQGKEIFQDEYLLSENGTMYDELALDEEASLGFYSIEANYEEQYFSHNFQVAEFRAPEFIVEVSAGKPEYANGETIDLTAQANFFFGGALANAEVNYSILSEDYFFNYTGPAGRYDFTDYDFFRSFDTFFPGFGELIDQGSGQTDAEGGFTLSVPADIGQRTTSQRFTLEVSVTDPDSNQVVSSRTNAIVHKGSFYIGARPQRYVSTAGEESAVDILTVDWASQPSPEQELTVVFAQHNWYSVQVQAEDGNYYWESQVETIPVFTETVTTGADGKATAAFTPQEGGIYRVSAEGVDEDGNTVRSSTFMWVSGNEFVNWRQENNDRLELVTDKQEYNVGDTATILVPHPYSGTVIALVTQERGHVYDYDVVTLETNSEQLEIPITAEMLPNMFLSVVIVKEPDGIQPIASFKVGYAQLPINVAEKEIDITLSPDKAEGETYRPGEEVTYEILAQDSEGNPVQAEFSLALVDKAILTLADEGISLLDHFWRERGLGVSTAATLALSADRLNLTLAPEAKGGGGGGFDEGFGEIRGDFRDTAMWVADFTTDEEGRGTVTTTLPDNLTTWVLTARGISKETLVGDERVEIVSTKPLLVRPVAPRFFVVGDEAQLRMVVQNNTGIDLTVETLFEGTGVELMDGEAAAEVEIAAGGRATLNYPVKATASEEALLRFGAQAEAFSDAVEITLPIHRHSTPETVGTAGVMDEDGMRLEGIALPDSYDPTQGGLRVTIDPSLASGMRAGLDYLEHFPYECSEQTVSRFLPNVVTFRAYEALNLENPELAIRLPGLVSVGLQRLYTQQHLDGGWGWWSNDQSDPFLSAYVVLGLVEAERSGFAVDEEVLASGIRFLSNNLSRPTDVTASWQANRQAFVLYVLAEAGEDELSRMVSLFDQREQLDSYGRAYLAMAFHIVDSSDVRITTLINDITGQAIVSSTGAHWEEAQRDPYNMNTDTRSTAIIIAALSRIDPDNALAPNAVRWLMSVRQNDRWETTQETAWAI